MKLRSVRYLTGEGIKNIWVNRLMSIASIGVLAATMLLIGVAIALSYNINIALGNLEKENVVMAYFYDEAAAKYDSAAAMPVTSGETDVTSDETTTSEDTSSQEITSDASSSEESASGISSESATSDVTTTSEVEAFIGEQGVYMPLVEGEDNAQSIAATSGKKVFSDEECQQICAEISRIPNVESAVYIPRDEGLVNVLGTLDEKDAEFFSFVEEDNPLSNGVKITMTDLSKFDETMAQITAIEGVDRVHNEKELVEKIVSIRDGITVAGLWIISLLLLITLIIVANTIRVTMYNRKLEISIMKAVGATTSFIRLPFIVEGVVIGLISATMTSILLYFVYNGVIDTLSKTLEIQFVPFWSFAWQLFGLFAAVGILAGLVGSFFMINKYLRKEGSDFGVF